jgi:hypothetical protein
MNVPTELARAIRERRLITVRDGQGRERTLQPHLIYRSQSGEVLLEAYQTGGYSSTGHLPAWRHLKAAAVAEFTVLEARFQVQPTFNPESPLFYEVIEKAETEGAASAI